MSDQQQIDPRLISFAAAEMQAKAALCDAQHNLQIAQAQAEAAQRELAMASQRYIGAQAFLLTEQARAGTSGQPEPKTDSSKTVEMKPPVAKEKQANAG